MRLDVIAALGLLFVGTAAAQEAGPVPGILPTGQGALADREIAEARAATARFRQAETAIAAGYRATTTCVAHPTLGMMGFHYKNAALRDGVVDARHPEILLYMPMPDGSVRLVGAEYVVPLASWTGDAPPSVFGRPMHRDENLGIWDLHAWYWVPNRAGIFADWNPDLKC